MVAFIFSAGLAFVAYQFLAFAHFPPARDWFQITRRVTISYDDASAVWVKRALRAGFVFAILTCVVSLHDWISPAGIVSRNKVAILIGFFFGPLLGIWLNGVFAHPPGQPLTRAQTIAGIALVILAAIGFFGNDGGQLIQQYSRHLRSLKLGGAELQFSDRSRAGLARAQPLSGKADFLESQAFPYLGQLDGIIGRDIDYIELFVPDGPDRKGIEGELKAAQAFAAHMLVPPASCLAGWFKWTADSSAVNRHVARLADIFRRMTPTGDADRQMLIAVEYIDESLSIAYDVLDQPSRKEILEDCAALFREFRQFCPLSTQPTCIGGLKAKFDGYRAQQSGLASMPAAAPERVVVDTFVEQVKGFLGTSLAGENPYRAIQYAGLAAELDMYPAGGAMLDAWIENPPDLSSTPVANAARGWMEVRARSMLAAYTEEWIGRHGEAATVVVRNNHMRNMRVIRSDMLQYLVHVPPFAKALRDARDSRTLFLRRPGACAAFGEPLKSWRGLFGSYVSVELTYVQNALLHPDYADSAETTSRDILTLANLDLSCVPDAQKPLFYAEILEAYARNALRYSLARREEEDDATAINRLDEARAAVRFALQYIETDAALTSAANAAGAKSYIERLTPTYVGIARRNLKATMDEIENARRELAR